MTPRRRSRRLLVLLASCLAIWPAGVAHATPRSGGAGVATDSAAATISGTISDWGANAITSRDVCIVAFSASSENAYRPATTDASGGYTLAGLAADSYEIYAYDCWNSSRNDAPAYYSTASDGSPTAVTVTSDQARTGINIKLAPGGSISGTIRDANGTPITSQDVCVDAGSTANGLGDETTTDASGRYEITRLVAGSYQMEAHDCWNSSRDDAPAYYSTASDGSPTTITLAASTAIDALDIRMHPGASISGTIYLGSGSSARLPEFCASAFDASGDDVGGTASAFDGTYTINRLTPGEGYRIGFSPCDDYGSTLATQYYNDQDSLDTANTVTPTASAPSAGVDAHIPLSGATISGQIADSAGKPIATEDVCVSVSPDAGGGFSQATGYATTDSSGHYVVAGLAAGSYDVQAQDCAGSTSNHVPAFYSTNSNGTPTPVAVTANQALTGTDITLRSGASISGTVTDSSGRAISTRDICVVAAPPGGGQGTSAVTDASGSYTIKALVSGSYTVSAFDCQASTRDDVRTDYSTASDGSATAVSLSSGQAQTRIDIQLRPGTTISGSVYEGSGPATPLQGVCVSVYDAASSSRVQVAWANTDSNGSYTATHLVPEKGYKVGFVPCIGTTYAPQFFNDKPDFASADTVTPTAATPSTGIDAHLTNGASLSGTVTDSSGKAITTKDVCVSADPIAGGVGGGRATTDASGVYTITGLTAGSYYVSFSDCPTSTRNDVAEYYGGAPDSHDSTIVALSSDGNKTGVDAQLAAGTSISGHVYAGAGKGTPLTNICVHVAAVYTPQGNNDLYAYNYSESVHDSTGAYAIDHVAPLPDGYRVQFSECTGQVRYVSQYYGGDYEQSTATTINPTVAVPATGIDGHLVIGGSITGMVSDSSGHPITSGVCASASMTGAGSYYGMYANTVSSSGTYTIGGLPTGAYRVTLEDCFGSTRNDVALTLPTPVSVSLGLPTTGSDGAMQPGTSISGHVYGGAGTSTPLSNVCVELHDPNGQYLTLAGAGAVWTRDDGSYTIGHLPPSRSYIVKLNACSSAATSYGTQYYDGVADPSQAAALTPTVATPSTAIDAHLPSGAPVTTITSGPTPGAETNATRATFSFTADQDGATFECALDAAAYSPCSSPYTTGTLSEGSHSLTVRATVDGVTETHPQPLTWTVTPNAPTATSQGAVSAGGTFSTNPGGQTSSSTPAMIDVTPPAASQVTLTVAPTTTQSGNGYTIFGQQMDISAAGPSGSGEVTGTVADPIKLAFTLDGSAIPTGTPIDRVTVTRNGAPAPNCTTVDGTATPAPCVESRTATSGGGVAVVILTTHCSTWNFATTSGTIAAPANSVAPAAPSGTLQEGQLLTADNGSWTNSPTSYAYQWEDCNSAGNSCTAITGATDDTYTLLDIDVGHTIRVLVTASNTGGPGTAAPSGATAVVVPLAPVSSVAPAAPSGTVKESQLLTADNGSWTNSPTSYAYQWEDCNSAGNSCTAITGATDSTYTLQDSDVGHTIRVVVTASNAGRPSTPRTSAATALATPANPVLSTAPATPTGIPKQAQTLTADNGSWTNSPMSYAYQWEDCNSAAGSCTAIAAATTSSYTLQPSDVGHTIRVLVTASNAGGPSSPAISAATTIVAPSGSPGGGDSGGGASPGGGGSSGASGASGPSGPSGASGGGRSASDGNSSTPTLSVGGVKLSGAGASVTLTCTGPAGGSCHVALSLSLVETMKGTKVLTVSPARAQAAAKKGRTVVVGSATAVLPAGSSEAIAVTLGSAGKRLLKQFHTLHATLIVSRTSAVGSTAVITARTLSFKAATKVTKHQK